MKPELPTAVNFPLQVLIVGQTGVGKSSLLNYLADDKLADIATGRPLTRGIVPYDIEHEAKSYRVFDSEGYEVEHVPYWRDTIGSFLDARGPLKPIDRWIHATVYCVQVTGARVQDVDLDMIRQLDRNGGLIVAFTKCDGATDEEVDTLRSLIERNFQDSLSIIEVVAPGRERRGEGGQQFFEAVSHQWMQAIRRRLPQHIYGPGSSLVEEWLRTTCHWVDQQNISLWGKGTREQVEVTVRTQLDDLVKYLEELLAQRNKDAKSALKYVSGTLASLASEKSFSTDPTSLKYNSTIPVFAWDDNPFINVGAAVAMIVLSPVLLPVAFIKTMLDDGTSDKVAICDELRSTCARITESLDAMEAQLREKLRE